MTASVRRITALLLATAAGPVLATGQEMASMAGMILFVVALAVGVPAGAALAGLLALLGGWRGWWRRYPGRMAGLCYGSVVVTPLLVWLVFMLGHVIHDVRRNPVNYPRLSGSAAPDAAPPAEVPTDFAAWARWRLNRLAQDIAIAWNRDPERDEAELLASRAYGDRQRRTQAAYDETEASLRAAQPGEIAALIRRHETQRKAGINQQLLLDRHLIQAPALTAADLAALEAYIGRRGVMQGEHGAELYARLIWGRDAAPGRLASLMDDCRDTAQATQAALEPWHRQFICELTVFRWVQKEGTQRLCVDGRYRPEDLQALAPVPDDRAREEFRRGEWAGWIESARAGCG